jgi:hypothetical protein
VVNFDLENEYISHFTCSFVMSVAAHEGVYGNLVGSRNTNQMQAIQRLAELYDGTEDQRINLKWLKHPIALHQIRRFEKNNESLSINVYVFEIFV